MSFVFASASNAATTTSSVISSGVRNRKKVRPSVSVCRTTHSGRPTIRHIRSQRDAQKNTPEFFDSMMKCKELYDEERPL